MYQRLRYRVSEINRNYQKPLQSPYAVVEPATKFHLILLPDYATLTDIAQLKLDAYQAEVTGNWKLARQLWIRVNVAARGSDMQAIEAFSRITQQSRNPLPVDSTPESTTSSRGEEITATETPPTQETKLQVFSFEVVRVNASGKKIKREQGKTEYFTEDLGNGVSLGMVYIPGGSFKMGTKDKEIERLVEKFNWDGFRREKPQHQVTVPAFFMGKFEVTQEQYQQVMGNNPSHFKEDKRPVEEVSWNDAVEFCKKLSQKTGRTYRLPSEAEWEYACRAGTTTPFYFGETITGELANYRAREIYASEPKGEYREQTTPVGQFPPNAFGLYDMHGNVWEWCQDTWHNNYNGAPKDGSASIDNNDSSRRVLRGGSWLTYPARCRSANRSNFNPIFDISNIGLRVVCVLARSLYRRPF